MRLGAGSKPSLSVVAHRLGAGSKPSLSSWRTAEVQAPARGASSPIRVARLQYSCGALAAHAPMIARRIALYTITALAELLGCYLPYLWLREGKSPLLLVPAALSLGAFAWLLTLHPSAAGRAYAAYGGVYIAVALLWLWVVDQQTPTRWDMLGVAVCLLGVLIIVVPQR